jgi:hypothetical protein
MKSGPRRIVLAIADATFEPREGPERLGALADEVLAFVRSASFASRVTLSAALWLLRLAPLFLFASWRPLDRMGRDRRREILARIERTPLGLAFVPWRMLLILHFYEEESELARAGYPKERTRHLAVLPAVPVVPVVPVARVTPAPVESGVRLRDDDGQEGRGESGKENEGAA